jgi:uncharacterized protein (DUF1330 family)
MAAYILARVDVTDWDRYGEYVKHTPRVIAQHGGRMIARGADVVHLEGAEDARRVVIIEFPTLAQARAFYDSPEYAPVRALREGAGAASIIAFEGYPEAAWLESLAASQARSLP